MLIFGRRFFWKKKTTKKHRYSFNIIHIKKESSNKKADMTGTGNAV